MTRAGGRGDLRPPIALVCWAAFLATVVAMPFLKEGYSPVDDAISYGAIGSHRWVQVAGFFALSTGTTLLALCLYSRRPSQPVVRTLLAASAAGVVVLTVFPIDARGAETTAVGRIHSAGAIVAFLTTVGAMLWAGWSFRDGDALAPLVPVSIALGSLAAALLVALGAGVGPAGLVQRATVVSEIAWLSAVALRLLSASAAAGLQPRAAGQSR